jgi:hypothetical protein
VAKTENQSPATRTQKEKPEHTDHKPKHHEKEKTQTDRPDNKAPEQEGKKVEDLTPNPEKGQDTRGDSSTPQTEDTKEEYGGGTFLEDVEHWIPSLFQPAQQGIASLKNDLLENTQEGGSPILGALAASGLDLLDTAMGMTEGIPLGILDLRNLGEGTGEALTALEDGGSTADVLRGLKKDASRALTIAGYLTPEGAVIKNLNRALTGADIVDSLSQGDYKGASIALATAALHEKGQKKLHAALVKFKGGKVPLRIQNLSKGGALETVASVYKDELSKAKGLTAWGRGKKAGNNTQRAIRGKYGQAAIEETSLGISSGKSHPGPRSDLYIYTGKDNRNVFIELKSNAKLENGRIMVTNWRGEWVLHADKQFSQSFGYQHVAKTVPNASSHIINGQGEIFSFRPDIGKWVRGIQ